MCLEETQRPGAKRRVWNGRQGCGSGGRVGAEEVTAGGELAAAEVVTGRSHLVASQVIPTGRELVVADEVAGGGEGGGGKDEGESGGGGEEEVAHRSGPLSWWALKAREWGAVEVIFLAADGGKMPPGTGMRNARRIAMTHTVKYGITVCFG